MLEIVARVRALLLHPHAIKTSVARNAPTGIDVRVSGFDTNIPAFCELVVFMNLNTIKDANPNLPFKRTEGVATPNDTGSIAFTDCSARFAVRICSLQAVRSLSVTPH
jgi:hypothetical protein